MQLPNGDLESDPPGCGREPVQGQILAAGDTRAWASSCVNHEKEPFPKAANPSLSQGISVRAVGMRVFSWGEASEDPPLGRASPAPALSVSARDLCKSDWTPGDCPGPGSAAVVHKQQCAGSVSGKELGLLKVILGP